MYIIKSYAATSEWHVFISYCVFLCFAFVPVYNVPPEYHRRRISIFDLSRARYRGANLTVRRRARTSDIRDNLYVGRERLRVWLCSFARGVARVRNLRVSRVLKCRTNRALPKPDCFNCCR